MLNQIERTRADRKLLMVLVRLCVNLAKGSASSASGGTLLRGLRNFGGAITRGRQTYLGGGGVICEALVIDGRAENFTLNFFISTSCLPAELFAASTWADKSCSCWYRPRFFVIKDALSSSGTSPHVCE